MDRLQQRQQQLLDYLMGNSDQVTGHIVEQGEVSVDTRLGIYRNAYRMRLKETLETDHEILGMYLGDELFEEMVTGYIDAYPSTYRSLHDFAEHLPDYLANKAPFSDYPLLSELAHFERLLLAAFDAGESERLTREVIAARPPESWPAMQLRFHPSMQLFQAQWNSVESWQALKAEKAPDGVIAQTQAWVIWRNPEMLTEFSSLADEEFQLLKSALVGQCFAELCDRLLDVYGEEKAGEVAVGYLLNWIEKGLLIEDKADCQGDVIRS